MLTKRACLGGSQWRTAERLLVGIVPICVSHSVTWLLILLLLPTCILKSLNLAWAGGATESTFYLTHAIFHSQYNCARFVSYAAQEKMLNYTMNLVWNNIIFYYHDASIYKGWFNSERFWSTSSSWTRVLASWSQLLSSSPTPYSSYPTPADMHTLLPTI